MFSGIIGILLILAAANPTPVPTPTATPIGEILVGATPTPGMNMEDLKNENRKLASLLQICFEIENTRRVLKNALPPQLDLVLDRFEEQVRTQEILKAQIQFTPGGTIR